MTLLIAWVLIYAFGLDWKYYIAALVAYGLILLLKGGDIERVFFADRMKEAGDDHWTNWRPRDLY